MKQKSISIALALTMVLSLPLSLSGCGKKKTDYRPIPGLDDTQQVTLKIAIPHETNKALNTAANAFMRTHSNVSVQLEYTENYDINALQLFQENALDMILQKDIVYSEYTVKDEETGEKTPTGTTPEDYFYNFATDTEIDFSNTTPDLTNNYRHTRTAADGSEITYQYCYPLGGEMRGVFVNNTFLESFGLSVPKNYTDFVHCCEVIKAAGYVPIQGHISTFGYGLGLAQAANTVVHDETALAAMSKAQAGISTYFTDTFTKIYTLCQNRYCDYKAIEGTDLFTKTEEITQAENFLGLTYDADTFEVIKPENNSGNVAFFPYISSTETVIADLIEEQNLDTKFSFICAPLNDPDTNSPVYITPYYGICANKNSENLIWIREFVNFLFQDDTIRTYATNAAIIPNTTDAMAYVAQKYSLDAKKDITLCGQINFSVDYNGFKPIANGLLLLTKCNAPKYMIKLEKDADGAIRYTEDDAGNRVLYLGNGETAVEEKYVGQEDPATPGYAFCTLQYYLDLLEGEFANYRVD